MIGKLREMVQEDAGEACSLTESEEWGFDELDFKRILDIFPGGSFVVEHEGKIIGLVTTSFYESAGYIGNVIVDAEHRSQGLGSILVKRAISHLDERGLGSILLYSYDWLEDFYEGFGFKPLDKYSTFRGRVRARSRRSRAEIMEPEDMQDVLRLDRYSFGDNRSDLLTRIRAEFPETCHVVKLQGEVVGYSMAEVSEKLTNVGPVVCIGKQCEGLMLESIGLVLDGREVFLTTKKGRNEELFTDLGLQQSFVVTRMARGSEPEGNPDTILAICALEKG